MEYDLKTGKNVWIQQDFWSNRVKYPFFFAALIALLISTLSCNNSSYTEGSEPNIPPVVNLHILGTVQDAGYPQMGCTKPCCTNALEKLASPKYVSCLGLSNRTNDQLYLFDATPDLKFQWANLVEATGFDQAQPNAIFLTHAHMGHYTGLMDLGREAMGANGVRVFAMPRMKQFLSSNGPWNQLLTLNQIELMEMSERSITVFKDSVEIRPILVPHRDEYSETVGYKIAGPNKTALFIPDIDKWNKWTTNLAEVIHSVDYAFLDGTFYDGNELPGRDMSEIPHPFVVETMDLLKGLSAENKAKVHFIHLNHTNPLLDIESEQFKHVISSGFKVAQQGHSFPM